MQERKGLQNLLKEIKKGQISFVVVFNGDRLARSPIEHQKLRKLFLAHNVPVFTSKNEERYDKGDIINQVISDGYSKFELDNIRTRTSNSLSTLLNRGQWIGGAVPYGYCYVKDTKAFTEIPDQIKNVKAVFDLYQEGCGFHKIAKVMDERDDLKKWNNHHVKNIVLNPFYAGYLTENRRIKGSNNSINENYEDWKMIPTDKIPKVITIEEWEKCWWSYIDKKKQKPNPKYYHTNYYFQNLLICTTCHEKLKAKNYGKGFCYYLCNHCGYKINVNKLHNLKGKIFENIASIKKESIKKQVKQSYHEDKYRLETQKNSIEQERNLLSTKVFNIEKEINFQSKRNQKENEYFIRALVLTKRKLTEKDNQLENELKELERSITAINEALGNEGLWLNWIEVSAPTIGDNDPYAVRRFFLSHIDEMFIDNTGKLEVTLKCFGNYFNYKVLN